MPLTPGTRIGSYEVVAPVGAGGMGQVYRARDTRLGRDVAIKCLPETSVSDPDLIVRFQREAEILATLNHPHIASIYGLEESGGSRFLILELVEGGTLAGRLAEGPLPLAEALGVARELADALHAAHEKGIVHRDLKPANIAIGDGGHVKVLDFGLAKALGQDPDSPTMAANQTEAGMILGTAAYMSPEQARGRPLDKRTDVWAFGCVLFELLTARHPFPGNTISDRIAAILERDPDWRILPAATPPRIRWLLRRCLEKDPRRRLHDLADARIEIDEAASNPHDRDAAAASPAIGAANRSGGREGVAWIIAAAAVVALIAALASRNRPPADPADTARVYSTAINLPDELRLWSGNPPGRFALSPDGRRLAVVGTDAKGETMLWVRPLDAVVAQPLAGTEGATFPFWSPDSRFIAFQAQGKLKRIDASGGPATTVCDAALRSPGSWSPDDVILFTPQGSAPLYRVPASGGQPSQVTTLDTAAGHVQHWYPSFLPDGRHFLYFVVGSKDRGVTDPRAVYIGSLDSSEPPKPLLDLGTNIRYANGHLVYLRNGTLVARPFDPDRLEVRGEAVPLVEQVQIAGAGTTGVAGAFSVSDTGALVYQTGFTTPSRLVWYDRSGKELGQLGETADYGDVSLSPDGRRAAVSVMNAPLGTRDIWLFDLARGLREKVTFDPGDDFAPIWSKHEGETIVFSSRRQGGIHLYRKSWRQAGPEALLYEDSLGKFASHWSADGERIAYVGGGGIIGRSDIWMLQLSGRRAAPFLETPFVETHPQFSPDGHWVAYTTTESGQFEVNVRALDSSGEKWAVSAAGGGWPRWRADGTELFYVARDGTLMAVAIRRAGGRLDIGDARALFPVRWRTEVRLDAYNYDVAADGQRFLLNTYVEDAASSPIVLVVNWPATLKK